MILSPIDSKRLREEKREKGSELKVDSTRFRTKPDDSLLQQSFPFLGENDSFWYGELSIDPLQSEVDVDKGSIGAEEKGEKDKKEDWIGQRDFFLDAREEGGPREDGTHMRAVAKTSAPKSMSISTGLLPWFWISRRRARSP